MRLPFSQIKNKCHIARAAHVQFAELNVNLFPPIQHTKSELFKPLEFACYIQLFTSQLWGLCFLLLLLLLKLQQSLPHLLAGLREVSFRQIAYCTALKTKSARLF